MDENPTNRPLQIRRRAFAKATVLGTLALAVGARAQQSKSPIETKAQNMDIEITRNGSHASNKGPSDWFTGSVRVDPLFAAKESARAAAALVTFEPGARTAWHTHPLGQTLIVTSGLGWTQREGGPVLEIRPGDVVWFPPGLKHWHGATATNGMSHIAIQEHLDGKVVDWMDQVTDAQYRG